MAERWTKADYFAAANIAGLVVVGLLGLWTAKIGNTTHDLVNSRMSELLELTRKSSYAEGVKEQDDKGVRK